MDDGENKVKQEDCSEDKLGPGILTLTNKRIAFDKTQARIMDFTKRMGETVLDVPLENVIKFGKKVYLSKKFVLQQIQKMGNRLTNLGFSIQSHG